MLTGSNRNYHNETPKRRNRKRDERHSPVVETNSGSPEQVYLHTGTKKVLSHQFIEQVEQLRIALNKTLEARFTREILNQQQLQDDQQKLASICWQHSQTPIRNVYDAIRLIKAAREYKDNTVVDTSFLSNLLEELNSAIDASHWITDLSEEQILKINEERLVLLSKLNAAIKKNNFRQPEHKSLLISLVEQAEKPVENFAQAVKYFNKINRCALVLTELNIDTPSTKEEIRDSIKQQILQINDTLLIPYHILAQEREEQQDRELTKGYALLDEDTIENLTTQGFEENSFRIHEAERLFAASHLDICVTQESPHEEILRQQIKRINVDVCKAHLEDENGELINLPKREAIAYFARRELKQSLIENLKLNEKQFYRKLLIDQEIEHQRNRAGYTGNKTVFENQKKLFKAAYQFSPRVSYDVRANKITSIGNAFDERMARLQKDLEEKKEEKRYKQAQERRRAQLESEGTVEDIKYFQHDLEKEKHHKEISKKIHERKLLEETKAHAIYLATIQDYLDVTSNLEDEVTAALNSTTSLQDLQEAMISIKNDYQKRIANKADLSDKQKQHWLDVVFEALDAFIFQLGRVEYLVDSEIWNEEKWLNELNKDDACLVELIEASRKSLDNYQKAQYQPYVPSMPVNNTRVPSAESLSTNIQADAKVAQASNWKRYVGVGIVFGLLALGIIFATGGFGAIPLTPVAMMLGVGGWASSNAGIAMGVGAGILSFMSASAGALCGLLAKGAKALFNRLTKPSDVKSNPEINVEAKVENDVEQVNNPSSANVNHTDVLTLKVLAAATKTHIIKPVGDSTRSNPVKLSPKKTTINTTSSFYQPVNVIEEAKTNHEITNSNNKQNISPGHTVI